MSIHADKSRLRIHSSQKLRVPGRAETLIAVPVLSPAHEIGAHHTVHGFPHSDDCRLRDLWWLVPPVRRQRRSLDERPAKTAAGSNPTGHYTVQIPDQRTTRCHR